MFFRLEFSTVDCSSFSDFSVAKVIVSFFVLLLCFETSFSPFLAISNWLEALFAFCWATVLALFLAFLEGANFAETFFAAEVGCFFALDFVFNFASVFVVSFSNFLFESVALFLLFAEVFLAVEVAKVLFVLTSFFTVSLFAVFLVEDNFSLLSIIFIFPFFIIYFF